MHCQPKLNAESIARIRRHGLYWDYTARISNVQATLRMHCPDCERRSWELCSLNRAVAAHQLSSGLPAASCASGPGCPSPAAASSALCIVMSDDGFWSPSQLTF